MQLISFLFRICTKICLNLNVQEIPLYGFYAVVFVLGGIDLALSGLLWFGIIKVLAALLTNTIHVKYITNFYEKLFRDAFYF